MRSLLGAPAADVALRLLAQCQADGDQALSHLDTERALPLSTGELARIGDQMGSYGGPDRDAICDVLAFLNAHAGHAPAACTPFRTDRG